MVATWSEGLKLRFMGAGRMAESILKGVIRSSLISPSNIRNADPSFDGHDTFTFFGVTILESNSQAYMLDR
ncbi:hypothetical protein QJS10_CPA05g00945 [Acorus calamus]|uniref:Pyrroline-5-carboxylate reductase n=1 Tax=Acorus calamus TaxID=4465 RepID=A0AAV9EUL3_ACOCL|nr:hypothetical protein QJS10_CPA05g00945 [Acorus calamus]